MTKLLEKQKKRRKNRVRAKISGTADRPRLSVFRSNKFIYAQLIDDVKSMTLLSVSDQKLKEKSPKERAAEIGKNIADLAKKKGVQSVVFDRSSYRYHGRIKTFAQAAREGGLQF